MATSDLQRFVHPETLSAIAPDLLRELLARWPGYVAAHALPIQGDPAETTPLGEAVAESLKTSGVRAPADLLDALYLIEEMSGERESEALREAAWNVPVLQEVLAAREFSPEDLATVVYLRARPVLDQLHAKRNVRARRSFDLYAALDAPESALPILDGDAVVELMRDIESGLARPGQLPKILGIVPFTQADEHRYLIRRCGAPRRIEIVDDRSPTFCFHPAVWDVVLVNPVLGELRINSESKKASDLYRRKFGLHLLGDEEQFPRSESIYTLAPLLEDPHALSCADIDGMEAVSLVGLSWRSATRPGASHHVKDGTDVLAYMRAEGIAFPDPRLLLEARMRILFSDSDTPRPAVVRVPNVASITRGPDARIFEAFLRARRIALPREGRVLRAHHQATLAFA